MVIVIYCDDDAAQLYDADAEISYARRHTRTRDMWTRLSREVIWHIDQIKNYL